MSTVLALETSCDDTSVALIKDGRVLSNVISSQPIHNDWGGIVPELASREHVKAIGPMTQLALSNADVAMDDVDVIAVTNGPGLPGSLLVGTQFAKGLAVRFGKPLIPIHHIEAHIYSGYIDHPELTFPSICLVVSGGHTSLFRVDSFTDFMVLGSTRDDAAGEAFDKTAKMLGLGYPGGPLIDARARDGNADAIALPRGLMHDESYDFSFSGLKTAVRYYLRDHPGASVEDVCASVQAAIVDVLVHKTVRAATDHHIATITIAGGVSANSLLRSRMQGACHSHGWTFVAPAMEYCVDNAAMIGFLAEARLQDHGGRALKYQLDFSIEPRALRAGRSKR
jgi:N6-L-threonylcarbamoyladenine synthase